MNHQSEERFMRDPLVPKKERTFKNQCKGRGLLIIVGIACAAALLAIVNGLFKGEDFREE